MGPRSRVRAAKCQMLVTSVFVLLLGLSVATMAVLTYFGAHSTVISFTSLESNPYKATHCWAFYTGMSLAGLLTLGATLSAAATVREAQGLMAGGFLSFALGFCILAQVAFWRSRNPTQVEDAALDTYDLVYEQAVKTASLVWQQELAAIQDTFLCCGKRSPFGHLGDVEASLCQGEEAAREDCLQSIQSLLRPHQHVLSTLSGIGLALMVYATLLSAFLCFAFRSGHSLDRRGKYALATQARNRQPQEPSLFRCSQGGCAPRLPSGADAVGDHWGLSGHSEGSR
ncbi:tetraspanin-32 isoform X3 [Nycticebus coucang]|uniref:tetraspanin-32 isoform X3 n=1 Tax=Nycticebus coucang TaxID=9470 RepID=UPI00234C829F|nr:tetraspanin-32 isoform X3 [Nycticebus coucang]